MIFERTKEGQAIIQYANSETFKKNMYKYGLTILEKFGEIMVKADGDCFFHTLNYYFNYSGNMRQGFVEFMKSNSSKYGGFIDADVNYSKQGEFADGTVVCAASDLIFRTEKCGLVLITHYDKYIDVHIFPENLTGCNKVMIIGLINDKHFFPVSYGFIKMNHIYPIENRKKECKYGSKCINKECKYHHPCGQMKICRNDGFCQYPNCKFMHLKQSKVVLEFSKIVCFNDGNCKYPGCKFVHMKTSKKNL
tara:strand:+ start:1482 stop:2231 length:750 start_codon:yes stop_codon:yes gene_type:complete